MWAIEPAFVIWLLSFPLLALAGKSAVVVINILHLPRVSLEVACTARFCCYEHSDSRASCSHIADSDAMQLLDPTTSVSIGTIALA